MTLPSYAPSVMQSAVNGAFRVRSAVAADVDELARIMAVRGGTLEKNTDHAQMTIERLSILVIAEKDGNAVGWCGVQKFVIHQGTDPEWLIAGLTVAPEARRQGVAARLLSQVLRNVAGRAPGEPVFSVINARNLASIDLHLKQGFVEVGRSASYAGIVFAGGEGVLLRHG